MWTSFVDELSTQISGKISQTVMLFLRKGLEKEGNGIKWQKRSIILTSCWENFIGVELNSNTHSFLMESLTQQPLLIKQLVSLTSHQNEPFSWTLVSPSHFFKTNSQKHFLNWIMIPNSPRKDCFFTENTFLYHRLRTKAFRSWHRTAVEVFKIKKAYSKSAVPS